LDSDDGRKGIAQLRQSIERLLQGRADQRAARAEMEHYFPHDDLPLKCDDVPRYVGLSEWPI
jgi:hypothetical protein